MDTIERKDTLSSLPTNIARHQLLLSRGLPHVSSSRSISSILLSSSLLRQPDQYHAIYEIMSVLSTKERRWQCSRVCRYWSIIVTHPFANRDLNIVYGVPRRTSTGYHIDSNDTDDNSQKKLIPFQYLRSIHFNGLSILMRGLFVPPSPSATKPSSTISLPMLTTLTLEGFHLRWNDLRHFFIVIAPQLQHLWIDVELTMDCHLVLDLFRQTRTFTNNNGRASMREATINGKNVGHQRCGRCQRLSAILMKCDKPGQTCGIEDTLWSSSKSGSCIPCLLDTNHRICTMCDDGMSVHISFQSLFVHV
jgi:hypothetical protein